MDHKILIIDDDEDITESVQMLLSHEGFDVIMANRIDEGLEKIESDNPELIILDLMFPESDTVGFQSAARIKEIKPDLPVFAFTAISRNFVLDFHEDDVPVEEFLVKPVNSKILVEKIKKYLN